MSFTLVPNLHPSGLPAARAIRIGSVFVNAANDVERVLANFVAPLTVEMHDCVGLAGSYSRLRLGDRCFAACTAHQISPTLPDDFGDADFQNLRFAELEYGQRLYNLPVDSALRVQGHSDEELSDAVFFHVKMDHRTEHRVSPSKFFPLKSLGNPRRLMSYAVGYPQHSSEIDNENRKAHLGATLFECKLDASYNTSAAHFRRFTVQSIIESANGLSGGAVFSLISENESFEFQFEGLIARGNKNFLHVIDADFIRLSLLQFDPNKV